MDIEGREAGVSLCDAFVVGFAAWTIVANATVLTGGSLVRLLLWFLPVGLLLVGWSFSSWKRTPRPVPADGEARHARLFWGIVVVAVCFTLVAHRSDADDSFYVNLAVAAVDEPGAPVLQTDTMHSLSEAPIHLPVYKTHSLELLAAAVSLLTRVPVIHVFHLLLPPLAAILTLLVYRRFFRTVCPRHWPWGVLAAVLFLLASGDVHASYGNMSFVRLHQGKGILVTALIPLLVVYGIKFGKSPGLRSWGLLFAAQVCSLGMSSTALWVTPLVATLAVLAGMPARKTTSQIALLLLGSGTSIYGVTLGLLIRLRHDFPQAVVGGEINPLGAIVYCTRIVFGFGLFGVATALLIVAVWPLLQDRLSRRLWLLFSSFVVLVFMNPLLVEFLSRNVTGVSTYWRFFWILPVPAFIGIALVAIRSSPRLSPDPARRKFAYFLVLLILCGLLPASYTFSPENDTRIGIPGLKVPAEHSVAKGLAGLLRNREVVLVPEEVSVWLTTFQRHPYPVLSRTQYGDIVYSGETRSIVLGLKAYVTGTERTDDVAASFAEDLERLRIEGVCFSLSNPWGSEIRRELRDVGFEEITDFPFASYEVWIRENLL